MSIMSATKRSHKQHPKFQKQNEYSRLLSNHKYTKFTPIGYSNVHDDSVVINIKWLLSSIFKKKISSKIHSYNKNNTFQLFKWELKPDQSIYKHSRCTIIPSTTKITTRPPTMTHPPVPPSSPESPNTGESYDLSYLLDDPLDAVENYPELMEMCLRVNNPHANYIKGVHEYFGRNNVAQGLDHLKRSADGKCDVATYLYGLLMLSRGNMHEGRRYLSTLGWNTNMKRAEQCWTNVKKSLKRFHITMEDCYVENMFLLKPARRCHVNSFAKRCTRCFLYKQVMQFVDYIWVGGFWTTNPRMRYFVFFFFFFPSKFCFPFEFSFPVASF